MTKLLVGAYWRMSGAPHLIKVRCQRCPEELAICSCVLGIGAEIICAACLVKIPEAMRQTPDAVFDFLKRTISRNRVLAIAARS